MVRRRAFVLSILALCGFSACSNSAYQHFHLSNKKERAASNLQVTTIKDNNLTQAYLGTLYLNQIDSENYFDHEYFVLSFYYPKAPENETFHITLNGEKPIYIQTLDVDDNLSKLFPLQMRWNHYYYLMFPAQTSASLKLSFENSHSQKVAITYQKDDE